MAINYNVAKCKNPNGMEGVDYLGLLWVSLMLM